LRVERPPKQDSPSWPEDRCLGSVTTGAESPRRITQCPIEA
jgi:hypothetical protein